MTTPTIHHIKQQRTQLATITVGDTNTSVLPLFWITDWLLEVLDKPALFLITDDDYQLTDAEYARFMAGVTKMQAGTPLAYLTGRQEFWSLSFKVNEHTLIPRPDTEVLIEQVLAWINAQPVAKGEAQVKRLLDLGTGSGCIAISLAHELARSATNKPANDWQVVAVDVSTQALEVARHNGIANHIHNIEWQHSSWYEALVEDDTATFEVIVSNPPYIDEADAHLMQLKAEPISALSAPNHGLADIEHIVQQAPQYLKRGGLLAIEHGFDQGEQVRQLFEARGFQSVRVLQDFGGRDRVTLGEYA